MKQALKQAASRDREAATVALRAAREALRKVGPTATGIAAALMIVENAIDAAEDSIAG